MWKQQPSTLSSQHAGKARRHRLHANRLYRKFLALNTQIAIAKLHMLYDFSRVTLDGDIDESLRFAVEINAVEDMQNKWTPGFMCYFCRKILTDGESFDFPDDACKKCHKVLCHTRCRRSNPSPLICTVCNPQTQTQAQTPPPVAPPPPRMRLADNREIAALSPHFNVTTAARHPPKMEIKLQKQHEQEQDSTTPTVVAIE
jgi:hypothetical protein